MYPPGAVRAILVNLLPCEVPSRVPGLSIIDSPWLAPFKFVHEQLPVPRHFSAVAQLETSTLNYEGIEHNPWVCRRHGARNSTSPISPTVHYSPAVIKDPVA